MPRVAFLVGGHVAAKRYLLTTDAAYRALLSRRSETTLGFQGGVMDADEAEAFVRHPDWEDLVALRRADDAAKIRGKAVPGLDAWAAVVEQVAAAPRDRRAQLARERDVPVARRELDVEERGDRRRPVGGRDRRVAERSRQRLDRGVAAGDDRDLARVRGPPWVPSRVSHRR